MSFQPGEHLFDTFLPPAVVRDVHEDRIVRFWFCRGFVGQTLEKLLRRSHAVSREIVIKQQCHPLMIGIVVDRFGYQLIHDDIQSCRTLDGHPKCLSQVAVNGHSAYFSSCFSQNDSLHKV